MWLWLRISKGIALLAFLLPWVTVSCSGTEIISVSGLNMVTGQISMTNPMSGAAESVGNGSPDLWAVLTLVAVVAGLIVAFLAKPGTTAKAPIVIGTSIVGLIGAIMAVARINTDDIASQAGNTGDMGGMGGNINASMITVDYKVGFWLVVLSLIASAVIAALIWKSKGAATQPDPVPASPDADAPPPE